MTKLGHVAVLVGLAGSAASAWGQKQVFPQGRAAQERPVFLSEVPVLRTGPHGRPSHTPPGVTDACNVLASLSTANFGGGQFVGEFGFAQTEMAAATYTVAASEFPIKINLTEVILITNGTNVTTTTHWSLLYYSGTPTNGTLVETFTSDDLVIPHAVIPPGTNGLNIQFSVDPGDPEQLFIPDNGSHTFTVAFRIDQHNNQTQNPCFVAPPMSSNAFPCVDAGGLQFPATQWLFGVNCGSFGCPANGGWSTLANLPSFCRPSGDWVMRTTWSGVNCTPGVGACCKPDGTCATTTTSECTGLGGTFQGDGVQCAQVTCPQPTGACCFAATGGCLVRSQAQCASSGGSWLGAGVACNGSQCPTTGSCCLPNGTCTAGVTSAACTGQGGVFRGLGTTCSGASCPDLRGACCTASGCTLETQGDCGIIGGVFQGTGSTCATACTGACCTAAGCTVETSGDCSIIGGVWMGVGSACTSCTTVACYPNCDQSTTAPILNVQDFSCFLNAFASSQTYANCDNSTTPPVLNVQDFSCFLNKFAAGCS